MQQQFGIAIVKNSNDMSMDEDFDIPPRMPPRYSESELDYVIEMANRLIKDNSGLFENDHQRNMAKSVRELINGNWFTKIYKEGSRKTFQFDADGITKVIYFNDGNHLTTFTR